MIGATHATLRNCRRASEAAYLVKRLPETPAGAVLSAWLVAFNSADPERIRAFEKPTRLKRFRRSRCSVSRSEGGFTLLRVEKNEPLSITALLQGKPFGYCRALRVNCQFREPSEDRERQLGVTTRPEEVAIPRLTEGMPSVWWRSRQRACNE